MVNKGQTESKKKKTPSSTKHKHDQEQVPQRGFKETLVSDNEESDNEELSGLVLGSRSLVILPSSAFFAPIIFSYWLLIHPEMKHKLHRFLRVDWTTRPCQFLPSFRMKFINFLLVWSWLCLASYPRTFLRSRAFHDDEMNWFRKRDHSRWV